MATETLMATKIEAQLSVAVLSQENTQPWAEVQHPFQSSVNLSYGLLLVNDILDDLELHPPQDNTKVL